MTDLRSRRRRRAGAILVWGLGCFVGIQALLNVLMERWQPGLRDREYGVKLSLLCKRLSEPVRRPLVVVLGSSRVATGVRGKQLVNNAGPGPQPLVFNFGIPA